MWSHHLSVHYGVLSIALQLLAKKREPGFKEDGAGVSQ